MTTKIKNFVKYGVPIIVLLFILFTIFFVSNKGDAEFGVIGNADSMIILLVLIILLYLIVGIIVWAIAKTNFIFLSALYSALLIIFTILIITEVENVKKQIASEKRKKERLVKQQKEQFVIDSLSKIKKKNPNDYENIEKRALFYFNRDILYKPVNEYKQYINDLLLVISHNSANFESYEEISDYYVFMKEHDKAIKFLEDTKYKASSGEINFSKKDIEQLELSLESAKQEKKQYLIELEANKKWEIKQRKIKKDLVTKLTEKFKNEGYNSKDLAERGYAYFYLGKNNEALADFNHAIKLNPQNRMALVQRANILHVLGRNTEAIEAYKDLINKYPDGKELFEKDIKKIKAKQ